VIAVNLHQLKDIACDVVVGCSIAHTFLPPWDADAIKAFPTLQKYYRLLIYLIGYVAINARSTVYPSISTQTVGGVNESVNNATGNDAKKT
jgi:hypothetical protein